MGVSFNRFIAGHDCYQNCSYSYGSAWHSLYFHR